MSSKLKKMKQNWTETQKIRQLLTIEATGDYAGAKRMLDTLGVLRPEMKATIASVSAVPVDIRPVFVTADELAP